MTQFTPPSDAPDSTVWPAPAGADYGPPPMSKVSVAGFVCSFLFCLPLAPLVALTLGIIGFGKTSGGRRRGRGFAIAAIPIAVVAGVVQAIILFAGYAFWKFADSARDEVVAAVQVALKASAPDVPDAAAELYQLSSQRFRIKVSREEFQNWMVETVARHGQLQSLKPGSVPFEVIKGRKNQYAIHLLGRFVSGEATIDVICAMRKDYRAEFDDLRVDGESPIPR